MATATETALRTAVELRELGRLDEAVRICDAVIAADPRNCDALHLAGVLSYQQGRLVDALHLVAAALRQNPGAADALANYGRILFALERHEEALASFDKVLALGAGDATLHCRRADALYSLGHCQDAVADYDTALRLKPGYTDAHANRAIALVALNRLDEALQSCRAALTLDPQHSEANYNAAIIHLCMGDFCRGWQQYECRWNRNKNPPPRPDFQRPMWRGEKNLHGKTILLSAEQGFGDVIQFVRYVPMVAALGAKVLLRVPDVLATVMATVDGVSQVIGDSAVLPDFDLYCPLLSLPLAFGTELATIPTQVPYIWPYGSFIDRWRGRLPASGRLRVGFCWAGNAAHLNDRNRSIELQCFAEILSVADVDFVSLQRDVSNAQAVFLQRHGVTQLGQEFHNFADTAAVVSMLDVVISVDTSVAHLAGAMAKATAVLIPFAPDFRWMLDRTDTPWYPTMRLYRQSAIGDWEGPVNRLSAELEAVTACRRSA